MYKIPDDTACPYDDRATTAMMRMRVEIPAFLHVDPGYCLDAPDLIPTGHYIKHEWILDSEEEAAACGCEVGTTLDTFKLAPFAFRED